MFRIKICGITNVPDAAEAATAGADAIGVNFYAGSPRSVDSGTAQQILQAVPSHVAKVGVFVNETVENVREVAQLLSLDYIQLHGDEPESALRELQPFKVIRAIRASVDCRQRIADHIDACDQLGCRPAAVLIDACAPGTYGGSGKTADWNEVREITTHMSGLQIILAGGLSPDNVYRAIREAKPHGVDVASGVETAAGKKDSLRMREFVRAAERGFASWATEPS